LSQKVRRTSTFYFSSCFCNKFPIVWEILIVFGEQLLIVVWNEYFRIVSCSALKLMMLVIAYLLLIVEPLRYCAHIIAFFASHRCTFAASLVDNTVSCVRSCVLHSQFQRCGDATFKNGSA
jgi:hypothetical protein